MSATYDPALIATSTRDYARLRFRDIGGLSGTTVTKPFLSDEEYDGLIALSGVQEGLVQIALAIAAIFNQKVQQYREAGGIDVVWPQRAQFYERQAADIRTYGLNGGSTSLRAGAPVTPTPLNDERLRLEPWPTCFPQTT